MVSNNLIKKKDVKHNRKHRKNHKHLPFKDERLSAFII